MITQHSTMQSPGWQQLMQMRAAQWRSAQLNPPCSASRSHWHKPPVADEMPKSLSPKMPLSLIAHLTALWWIKPALTSAASVAPGENKRAACSSLKVQITLLKESVPNFVCTRKTSWHLMKVNCPLLASQLTLNSQTQRLEDLAQ